MFVPLENMHSYPDNVSVQNADLAISPMIIERSVNHVPRVRSVLEMVLVDLVQMAHTLWKVIMNVSCASVVDSQ